MRLLGWGLLAAAFLAAALETAAQGITHNWGSMPARDVLEVLAPDLFDAFRDRVDSALDPAIWDYVVLPLLILPGWLLIGVPGGLLVWLFRPAPHPDDAAGDSFPQASYEEIVAAAHEADKDDIGIPSKYRDLEEYDPSRQPADEGGDPALDPLYLEQADVIPPARHIPSSAQGSVPGNSPTNSPGSGQGNGPGNSDGFGGGLNRPF
ncbi:MAG: hypothetical protein K0Q70_603 [Rhodospirillales bacterium]|jgi:hypothetical protein|nr:hypothetical protein [Rhodospirillales bacterium]